MDGKQSGEVTGRRRPLVTTVWCGGFHQCGGEFVCGAVYGGAGDGDGVWAKQNGVDATTIDAMVTLTTTTRNKKRKGHEWAAETTRDRKKTASSSPTTTMIHTGGESEVQHRAQRKELDSAKGATGGVRDAADDDGADCHHYGEEDGEDVENRRRRHLGDRETTNDLMIERWS